LNDYLNIYIKQSMQVRINTQNVTFHESQSVTQKKYKVSAVTN